MTTPIVASLVLVALAFGAYRMLRRMHELDRLLGDSKQQLEHLQRQFERFVPGDARAALRKKPPRGGDSPRPR